MIRESILECIGDTPLVRLNHVCGPDIKCTLLAKCEFLNPGGSVKDRPALEMLARFHKEHGTAEERPVLVAPSSGNMGIGLCLAAVVLGYPVHIVMPDKMSAEKTAVLRALGATVHLTPEECAHDHPLSLITVSRRLRDELGGVIMDQYSNDANPQCHHRTADEILRSCPHLSAFVAGAGSGGTLTGVAGKLPPGVQVIGVDPVGSILADPLGLAPAAYAVEGIGYDFVPQTLDRARVHRWERITDADAFAMARQLIRREGLLVGGSSGAAVAGALQAIRADAALNQPGKQVVVVLPDSIRNYLGKFVSDDWMAARYFCPRDMESIESDPSVLKVLNGPLLVAKRTLSLLGDITALLRSRPDAPFPVIICSLNDSEPDMVVGLVGPTQLLRARHAGLLVLEKNFCLVPREHSCRLTISDLIGLCATGYPVIVQHAGQYHVVSQEALLAHHL